VTGRTHKIVGGSVGLVASTTVLAPTAFSIVVGVGVAGVAAASSSLPDSLEKLLRVKHRTVTHWPSLQLAIIGAITWTALHYGSAPPLLAIPVAIGVAIGCLAHSLADAMTIDPRGIALLWPIRRRGYHIVPRSWRVRVDSKSTSEKVFVALWCAFVLIYAYERFGYLITS
jgi:membrane-bound metal-dependent hydrolase YbcI (DUF457 family)